MHNILITSNSIYQLLTPPETSFFFSTDKSQKKVEGFLGLVTAMKLLSNQSDCSFHCITVSKPVYTSNFKSLWSHIFPFTPYHLTFYIKHEIFHFLPLSLLLSLFFFFFNIFCVWEYKRIKYTFRLSEFL